ncbi:MAG: phage major capsid protein [Acidaminococcaceae bacterium]|nr:phage major capsid protein [Acidaminococcaceae bacterium]
MGKRLKEIFERKMEIRKALEGTDKVDLDALKKELDDLEAEEKELRRRAEMANAINTDGIVPEVRAIQKPVATAAAEPVADKTSTMEYRKAFMNYVRTGIMGAELRDADANTTTSDIGVVIPKATMNRIYDQLSSYGNILALVTKTNYLTGVNVPVSSSKPTASWVAEGAGSYKREKTVGSVVFGHYKLRIAVSVSLEAEYMSLEAFETALVNNIAEAMTKALEAAIVSGDGDGKPTGILHVPDGTTVGTTQEVHTLTYDVLTAAEAALPVAYENGAVWVMAKQTFMGFVGMTDQQGQPIAHVNFGIDNKTERYLLGRPVILTDNLNGFTAASVNDIFAFIFRMQDYMLNTNFTVGIKTYEDNDTDDIIRKSIMVCDGHPIDTSSLIKLKKIAVPQAEAAAGGADGQT